MIAWRQRQQQQPWRDDEHIVLAKVVPTVVVSSIPEPVAYGLESEPAVAVSFGASAV